MLGGSTLSNIVGRSFSCMWVRGSNGLNRAPTLHCGGEEDGHMLKTFRGSRQNIVGSRSDSGSSGPPRCGDLGQNIHLLQPCSYKMWYFCVQLWVFVCVQTKHALLQAMCKVANNRQPVAECTSMSLLAVVVGCVFTMVNLAGHQSLSSLHCSVKTINRFCNPLTIASGHKSSFYACVFTCRDTV